MGATLSDIKSVLEEQNRKIVETIKASRVTNALLLAQAMRLDLTVPQDAAQVLRHLSLAEKYVGADSND